MKGRDFAYMKKVKQLPCVICGSTPCDAHHCTHIPDFDERGLYERIPGAGMKSHDRDTIPLCKIHHQHGPEAIHNGKQSWRDKHGPDYKFIGPTRAAVADMEIDF